MTVRFLCTTEVRAPVERVFDLSLDVGMHAESMARFGERAVAGVQHGRLGLGDEVTWRATHFGLPWTMTSRIIELDRPNRFVDRQVRGPFAAFSHEHRFAGQDRHTLMLDQVAFDAPFGLLGDLTERFLLERYVRRLIERRNRAIAAAAER